MAFFDNCLFESSDYMDIDLEAELADADIEETDIDMKDEEAANEIYSDFCRECYRMEAAMYIADIGIEHSVLEGANASVLVENALTDLIEKAKKSILKVWDAVTKFLRESMAKVRAFMNGCHFFMKKNSIDSLKKKLAVIQKDSNWADKKWSGYTFSNGTGFFKAESKQADTELKKALQTVSNLAVDKLDDVDNTDEALRNATHKVAVDLIGAADAKNIDDVGALASAYSKKYVGEEKTDIKFADMTEAELTAMYDFLKNAQNVYLAITSAEAETKKNVKKAIDALNKLKKDANEENSAKIHRGVKYNNFLIKMTTKLCTTLVKCVNMQMKQYGRLLKQIGNASDKPSNENKAEEKKAEAPAGTGTGESFSFFDRAYDIL